MTIEVSPQDFDLDAWIAGADRPERAVTVYRKAGLVAEMDILEQQIKNADEDEVDGPSIAGGAERLHAKYADLVRRFNDSALTVRVQSRTKAERLKIAQANPDLDAEALGFVVIADAMTSPKASAAQLESMQKAIGEAQFGLIIRAFNSACNDLPEVSADFLPKPSTRGDGGES